MRETALVANFTANITSGKAPLAVRFTDLSTGLPAAWNWSFGDGSVLNATERSPVHTYTNGGTYTVSLTISNAAGSNTRTIPNYITVTAPPVANFNGTPVSGTMPLNVTFADLSTNLPTSWIWNFGDGGYSVLQNPSHMYSDAGTYTVTLTATNAEGTNTRSQTRYITVNPGGVPIANVTINGSERYVFVTQWGSGIHFQNPYGVATDSVGNIYVADTDNNQVQKFYPNGTFITKWGSYGSSDGNFSSPHGVAVDAAGNVYVADSNNHRIQKFNSSGSFITKWGASGSGDGQFSFPYGVATDAGGNLYVADSYNNRV